MKVLQMLMKRFGQGILAILILAGGLTAVVSADTSSDYESLRLLSEALNEISTKAVFQKNDVELFHGALRGMMSSLDPDSSYLSPEQVASYQRGKQGAGAEAGMELVFKDHMLTAVSVLDGGPADRAGLKAGDHITKIDGQLIRNTTTQEGEHYFQGPAGKTLKLEVIRNGLVKPLDLNVTLGSIGQPLIKTKTLKDGYVYLRVPYFSNELPKSLSQDLTTLIKSTPPPRGLILDLRNNARGTLDQAVHTASLFLGKQKVVSTGAGRAVTSRIIRGTTASRCSRPPCPWWCWWTRAWPGAPRSWPGPCRTTTGPSSWGTRLSVCAASPSRCPWKTAPPCS